MTTLMLVSILPWCALATASAATRDSDMYVSDEAVVAQDANVTEASTKAPLKKKRIAVLQQSQCGAHAPMLSGIDSVLFFPRNGQSIFTNPNFTERCAQAPPTSPPRSV